MSVVLKEEGLARNQYLGTEAVYVICPGTKSELPLCKGPKYGPRKGGLLPGETIGWPEFCRNVFRQEDSSQGGGGVRPPRASNKKRGGGP